MTNAASLFKWFKGQCSPYQAVTGKIYRLKQGLLPVRCRLHVRRTAFQASLVLVTAITYFICVRMVLVLYSQCFSVRKVKVLSSRCFSVSL